VRLGLFVLKISPGAVTLGEYPGDLPVLSTRVR